TGREVRRQQLEPSGPWVTAAPLTTAGKGRFAYDRDGQVIHIDLATGTQTQVTTEVTPPVNLIHGVSGTTVFVNTPDGKVRQWDAATGRVVQAYDPPRMPDGKPCGVSRAARSPDGRLVVILSTVTTMVGQFGNTTGSYLSLYDAATGALRKRWQ